MKFLNRVVERNADGLIGPTLYEQPIVAETIFAAVADARRIDLDIGKLGGNALYLIDDHGRPVWSLHVPSGPPIEPE